MDMEGKLAIAALLLDRGAVKVSETGFRLKKHEKDPSAPLSPVYLEIRSTRHPTKPGPLTDKDIDLIARELYLYTVSEGIKFDGVCGVPEAGNPIAEAFWRIVSLSHHRMPVLLKKEVDGHGKRRITGILDKGDCEPGDIILPIDDLVSEADTKFEVIKVLRADGFRVNDILVVVDREQGGREELAEAECELHALFLLTDLLCFGVQTGRVTDRAHRMTRSYLEEERHRRKGGSP